MALEDTQVTLEDFRQWVRHNVPSTPYDALSAQAKSRLLDQMLEEKVLLHAARSAGVRVSESEVEDYLDQWDEAEARDPGLREGVRERLTIKRYREKVLLADLQVSDEEVRSWYRSHREEYAEPPRYLVRYIFLDDEEEIRKALEQLDEGQPFETVASRNNRNPLQEDARWVRVEDLSPALADALRNLHEGERSPVIQAPEGFYILWLEKVRKGGTLPLETVRERVEKDILRKKSAERIEETIQRITGREPFLFMPENLDFRYEL